MELFIIIVLAIILAPIIGVILFSLIGVFLKISYYLIALLLGLGALWLIFMSFMAFDEYLAKHVSQTAGDDVLGVGVGIAAFLFLYFILDVATEFNITR